MGEAEPIFKIVEIVEIVEIAPGAFGFKTHAVSADLYSITGLKRSESFGSLVCFNTSDDQDSTQHEQAQQKIIS